MTAASRQAAVVVAVGGVTGVGSELLAGVEPLAATTAVVFGVVGWLVVRHPDTVYEQNVDWWAFGRWSAVGTVVLVGATAGGTGWLNLGWRRLAAVQLFVVGVGTAMWLLGVSYARAKSR